MERSGSNIDSWSLAEGQEPSLENTHSRVPLNTRSVNENAPAHDDTGTSTPSKVTLEAFLSYYDRGTGFMQKGDNDRALDDFNKGLSMKPYFDYQIYLLRADIYRKKGMKEKAREDLKRVIDYAPKNAETVIENARKMLNLLDIP